MFTFLINVFSTDLSLADELVSSSTQVITAGVVSKSPTAGCVVGDGDFELGSVVFLFGVASDIAKLIDGQVTTKVRFERDQAA